MKKVILLISLILIGVAGLVTTSYVSATPCTDFAVSGDDVFDEWGICRTRSFGEDGFYQLSEETFRPVISFESLGKYTAHAYALGEQFANEYPDVIERAERMFLFVRDRVEYTPDIDQFKYDEFAQNADEVAVAIENDGNSYGDCEDSTVLLAVMYKGAGYRSAIAVGHGHTAVLVYLPEYKKATAVFELDGELGWIWAEATGKHNSLGWVPKEFRNIKVATYEISTEPLSASEITAASSSVAQTGGGLPVQPFPFIGVIGILWLLSLFRRRR